MYAKPEVLESFFDLVDLFIVDLKLLDSGLHMKYTGTDNDLILSNFKKLTEANQNVLVRIPLIPGITAVNDNIKAIADFVGKTSPETPIELINFNPLSESKYRLMGKEYEFLTIMKPFTEKQLDEFYALIEAAGVKIKRETAV
jgi:pyruvate formate lyase activating enzyme